mmetsp:Transcript_45684/g.40922  ORF Transcript_45684/g.40922 Transcript_45684/m.40922 type:complete len:181 (-) Transcript_45684:85-627(-)|eukprot:CAMPEP_0201573928 /NCGR_PEP_ID=MMETSP0190_2-20130828/18050_1 /ASSEMBLY_ACC=CAM_ASM_000263 /TAXON_ID=37353 /ORGANISM="Rosalina sp." /LENGTH=180 /DNA_ID=CAMNT_0048001467 /DNA_START=64 /DNA_END=606 /DNA_ORIENTATION=-
MAKQGNHQGETPTCVAHTVGTNLVNYMRDHYALEFNADTIISYLEDKQGHWFANAMTHNNRSFQHKDSKGKLYQIQILVIPVNDIDKYLKAGSSLYGAYKPNPNANCLHAVSVNRRIGKTTELLCYNWYKANPTIRVDQSQFRTFSFIKARVTKVDKTKNGFVDNGNKASMIMASNFAFK